MEGMKKQIAVAVVALAAIGVLGCSGELTDDSAPVVLVVTNSQNVNRIDLAPNDDPECEQDIGTINMQVIAKSGAATGNFVQVRVSRYRVSYRRLDGGTQVPAPFVRPIDTLIGVGESAGLSRFLIIEGDAIRQAPFVALLPQNGGRDPETNRPVVQLQVIVEIFGETLGGDRVYDSTSFPLDFCYACGGCD